MQDKKIIIGIGLFTIAVFVGIILLSSRSKSTSPTNSSVPLTGQQSDLLKVVSDDWIKGNKEAKVILVEYLDFECEACGAYYPLMKQLSEEFKNDVLFVNRYFPLPGHKNSMSAATAVEAASKQGKYWEMHNLLFDNQKSWGEKPASDPKSFESYATQLGLNIDQYKKDVSSNEVKERVERDKASGNRLGVSGTPSFFLNGQKIQNPRSIEDFRTLIKAELLKNPTEVATNTGEKVHEHADFKVYLNGKVFDFTQAKYQSSDTNPLDPDAHLHDGNGDVTHKHRKGITLSYFFKSIGMNFDKNCFALDTKEQLCSENDRALKFFVNGEPNDMYGDYEFTDLDKILISYGSDNQIEIQRQLNSVTDDACMYSEKCPERGAPPTENCVGGLGSDC